MVEQRRGSALDAQDKMQGVGPVAIDDSHSTSWNHECLYCESKNLEISVLEVPYRPHQITDFSNLPKSMRSYYRELPTIVEAVMSSAETGKNIVVTCVDCNQTSRGFHNREGDRIVEKQPNKAKLRRYLKSFYGVTVVMNLWKEKDNE